MIVSYYLSFVKRFQIGGVLGVLSLTEQSPVILDHVELTQLKFGRRR